MNIIESVFNEPIFYDVSITLLHFLWQGAVLAFLLYALLRVIGDKHSNTRYLLSLATLFLTLIAPLITYFVISSPSRISPLNEVASSNTELENLPVMFLGSSNEKLFDLYDLVPILSICWMIGVLLSSTRLILEMLQVYQLPRKNIVATPKHITSIFSRLLKIQKINRTIRLVISKSAEVPMVIGWVRPVVLVPFVMSTGLSTSQLEMLLAHEIAHIKRHDYFINFIQALIEVLFFFHPSVKWISKQIRAEREYCCDDVAIKHNGNALAYAHALTDAELLRPHNIPELAMAASGGDLKKRIFRAVGHQTCSPKYSGQWLVSFLSFALVSSIFGATHVSGISKEPSEIVLSQVETLTEQPVNNTKTILPSRSTQSSKTKEKRAPILSAEIKVEGSLAKKNIEKKSQSIAPKKTPQTERIIKPSKPVKLEIPAFVESNKNNVMQTNKALKSTKPKALVASRPTLKKNRKTIEESPLEINKEPSTPAKQPITKVALIEDINKTPKAVMPVVTKPRMLSGEMPYYPSKANSKNMSGEVKISYVVNEYGRVRNIEFKNKIHYSFRRAVKHSILRWRFEPATKDGKKIAMKMNTVFDFTDPTGKATPATGTRITR